MKILLMIPIVLSLSACSMSIEEYNARVKYCKDNGMDFVAYRNINYKPHNVECKAKDGSLFESKEAK